MPAFKEQLLTDKTGKPIGVFFDLDQYQFLLGELEELESVRAYDAAKASGDQAIPFDQAVAEIERDQR
jgi:hypothetical protein